ncbi:MAG: tRNA guanosine(34) transglycosylase Tgt [Holosporales bacterium]|nr:tRNA guanosine(34) transglycosylase Tgt [Holosporales bacterium]
MFEFRVVNRSSKSRARVGIISTKHGVIHTPAFIFCATKANVKGLTIEHIKNSGTQVILSNAYHLMLQPGNDLIRRAGGLHRFISWDGPMFTDSGGFQIFSLGHGSVSSEIKGTRFGDRRRTLLRVTEEGAEFRSYIEGRIVNLTPELSMQIQMDLGADIIVTMDECTPYHVSKLYTANSMEKSKRWAIRSLNEIKKYGRQDTQALLAVIQGGIYKDLRQESAQFANENDFPGFAIGGSLGKTRAEMYEVIGMTTEMLDQSRYVHLLGIGGIDDIFEGVRCGIDTFDCVAPTRVARHGVAIVKSREVLSRSQKGMNLRNSIYYDDFSPISESCSCYTCRNFSRAYIHHLLRAREILAGSLISIHNIFTMNRLMSDIRIAISEENLDEIQNDWCKN